jgi:hypothetical protein
MRCVLPKFIRVHNCSKVTLSQRCGSGFDKAINIRRWGGVKNPAPEKVRHGVVAFVRCPVEARPRNQRRDEEAFKLMMCVKMPRHLLQVRG